MTVVCLAWGKASLKHALKASSSCACDCSWVGDAFCVSVGAEGRPSLSKRERSSSIMLMLDIKVVLKTSCRLAICSLDAMTIVHKYLTVAVY